ncbi:hypothetical protein [Bacillus thuringiensis]|uniref:hypothetical protein n=1 Tax=Bacillus thuringiensis TaxID=1428 RepID=UPI00119D2E7E|nr:hypothetical protein [Bacillus thuringiensis]
MNLVNGYFILEGNHGLSVFPVNSRKTDNCTRMELSICKNKIGTFRWGKQPLLLHGFEIDVYVYDEKKIICFTSTVLNVLKVCDFIAETVGTKMNIMRLPMKKNVSFQELPIKGFKMDPIIGASFTFSNKKLTWPMLVKVYTNGLTTFNMTSNQEVIEEIVSLNIKLIELSNKD